MEQRIGANLTQSRLDRGSVYGYERECELEHCGAEVPDEVGIHLCAKHLRKAWAAYQLIQGGKQDQFRGPQAEEAAFWDVKGYVYFTLVDNLVKIGWSKNPARRKFELGADAILYSEPGTRRDEANYHKMFAKYLDHGKEWFKPSLEIQNYIRQLQSGVAA